MRQSQDASLPDISKEECAYLFSVLGSLPDATAAPGCSPEACEGSQTCCGPAFNLDGLANSFHASGPQLKSVRQDIQSSSESSREVAEHMLEARLSPTYSPIIKTSSPKSQQPAENLLRPQKQRRDAGWAKQQAPAQTLTQAALSGGRWDSLQSGQTRTSDLPPVESGRGRKAGKDASVNALAQRRYHQKLKAEQQEREMQLFNLTKKIRAMLQERKGLEVRNKNLNCELVAQNDHLEEMRSHEGLQHLLQDRTLRLIVGLIGTAYGQKISFEEAQHWTVGEYMTVHYQALVRAQSELCRKVAGGDNSDALKQLTTLVKDQENLETISGRMSYLHWTAWVYNMHYTHHQQALPGPSHWTKVLEHLNLTPEQEAKVLESYQSMHAMLLKCAEERNNIIFPNLHKALNLFPKDDVGKSPAGTALARSLRLEQSIVTGFLMAIDDVLTVLQKGTLETASYPWSPEWLPLCALISMRKGKQPLQFPVFIEKFLDVPILPQKTAFEILQTSVTALGLGPRLRQGLITCPSECVTSTRRFPFASFEDLAHVKLLDAMKGIWTRWPQGTQCWQEQEPGHFDGLPSLLGQAIRQAG